MLSAVGDNVTGNTSGTSYDTSTTSVFPAELNTGDLVGPAQLSVTASETDTSTDSTTFSGNDISGYTYSSSHEVDTLTRAESVVNASSDTNGDKFSLTTVDSTESANSITGIATISENTTASFSNSESDTNRGLTTSNTETGTSSGTAAARATTLPPFRDSTAQTRSRTDGKHAAFSHWATLAMLNKWFAQNIPREERAA